MTTVTPEQVLRVLPQVWVDQLGIHAVEVDYRPDDNLIDWLEQVGVLDDIDLADLPYRWRSDLGLVATNSDFVEFLNQGIVNRRELAVRWEADVKPRLTFRRLAEWIAARTPMPSFEPVSIAGRECRPAGAFYGVVATVQNMHWWQPLRIGPSQRLRDHLRGKLLDQVWRRLNLYCNGDLGHLQFPFARLGGSITVAAFLSAIIGSLALVAADKAICITALVPACFFVGAGGIRMIHAGDPLPRHIQTFRDLACEVAGLMHPAAQSSAPPRSTSA